MQAAKLSHADLSTRAGLTIHIPDIIGTILLCTLTITTVLLAVGCTSEWMPVEQLC